MLTSGFDERNNVTWQKKTARSDSKALHNWQISRREWGWNRKAAKPSAAQAFTPAEIAVYAAWHRRQEDDQADS